MLIKPGKSFLLLFLKDLKLAAPKLLFEEIEHNKDLIIQKSGLKKEELESFIDVLKERTNVVSEKLFLDYCERAEEICPHDKDLDYFALALYLECGIWTNEKKLKQQTEIKIYSTFELMNMFGLKN